ncbi:hypothetical protein FA13DRAFT_1793439 [Coprinellus micaceus]|uniref:Uncharacterized protein n=1 Tax=Coprinellus micaceus TaxID=71717 RepID=A0A4Y7T4J4_COPMI|nr:hypothetical protein FA13DRAFT_1793439 [Coprinellus micaceus]
MAERNSPFPVYFEPTFKNLYGAQLIAAVVQTFFYGAAFLVVLQYFTRHSKNDPIFVKATVGILLIFATLQTISCNHQAYDAFILNNGKPERFNLIVFSAPLAFLCSYIVAFIVQIFFATRIWSASRHFGARFRLPVIPVVMLAILQFGSGIAQTVLMYQAGTYEMLNLKTLTLIKTTCLQGAAAALMRYNYHGVIVLDLPTNSLVEKLSIYAINRAAATSVAVLLDVFLYYFASGTYYFLTTREYLREDIEGSFHISHLVMSNRGQRTTTDMSNGPSYTSNSGNDMELAEKEKQEQSSG